MHERVCVYTHMHTQRQRGRESTERDRGRETGGWGGWAEIRTRQVIPERALE